ncbi:transketolase [Sporolactobacillus sp. KGMB 08714]|uniref:transketolase n=1 Tax=Sporolactobacillus sp. KGMB 08714 TaxID=3064704 RepID=UPI002FBE8326
MNSSIDQLSIDTIRTLSIDAIEKAKSGHPGLPMGAAPMAYTLWAKVMKHNPYNSNWFNRDRFVLSAGHGSMLLYSLLYLFHYGLTIEDLKNFRQWRSLTPGHPEFGHTIGVEATTGPLGQGVAMAVGMAIAEAHLAALYNRDSYEIIDHHTFVICGDGDLMEGVSSEAASLAGHLKLGKLIMLYDSNKVSLDGKLDMAFSENVRKRFNAYGWQTLLVKDGNDADKIEEAISKAKGDPYHPTLIEVQTVIGYGAPHVQGTNKVHGNPLGPAETVETKKRYGWKYDPFYVPEEVKEHFNKLAEKCADQEREWNNRFTEYEARYPHEAKILKDTIERKLPKGYGDNFPVYEAGANKATRAASGEVINVAAKAIPQLFGGSADLASSTKTEIKYGGDFLSDNYVGRNIWFGVREFAMTAAVNGMVLHKGVIPFCSTFLTFSDYSKPAIRLAAIMGIPSIFVFTHDSIAVGEDGPTHEPIEQLAGLRAIPNLNVIRPADGNETREAWKIALESTDRPTVLILTRQNVESFEGEKNGSTNGVKRGGYIVSKELGTPDAVLIATGSEVELAIKAQKKLEEKNIKVRVVSMPSWELFHSQSREYQESILPSELLNRVAIEMASPMGWKQFVGESGHLLTINHFGASAPGPIVINKFGFTVENVTKITAELIKNRQKKADNVR